MQPKTTIWQLEPHTAAKHEILRRYLQAWAPILSQGRFPHLVVVDGFAGPGRYSKREEGSPLIAIRAVVEQPRPISAKVDFHFIELDGKRADHLEEEIGSLALPPNIRVTVHGRRSFQDAFLDVWNGYTPPKGRRRPPTFVFIDPFGFKIPLSYIERVMRQPSCEVLVNFMFEEINRFLTQEHMTDNFNELFGCEDWRQCAEIKVPSERVKFLHDLYQKQLTSVAGAKFVRSFAMRNAQNRMDYFLFFATNVELGLRKMKEAMWRVDESGTYSFSDATNPNQAVLFADEPDRSLLAKMLCERFSGEEFSVDEVETFVVRETPFRESHYKKVLASLEGDGRLLVLSPPRGRRAGKYPDGAMRLRLTPEAQ